MYDIWATSNSVTYEVLSEPIRHSEAHKDRQTQASAYKHVQREHDTLIYFLFLWKTKLFQIHNTVSLSRHNCIDP